MKCVLCGGESFIGSTDRPYKVCEGCGAMERHRFLAEYIQTRFQKIQMVLEIAPLNKYIYGSWLLKNYKCDYLSVDKWFTGNPVDRRDVSFIDATIGMEELSVYFPQNMCDLVIFQHVLEEIPDYQRALGNIGYILNDEGFALMEIPIQEPEYHISKNIDKFGNVWRFGLTDMMQDLKRTFSSVEHIPFSMEGFRSNLFVVKK